MVRTRIHAAFRENVDAITTVRTRLDAAADLLNQGLAGVSTQLLKISDPIAAVSPKLDDVSSKVINSLADISDTLGLIHTAIVPVTADQLTDRAFACIRALNQVEDLVTDHDFDWTSNSRHLAQRLDDTSTQDCLKALGPSTELSARFQAMYQGFDSNDFTPRAERYVQIDQLRRDIIRHFAQAGPVLPT